MTAPSLPVFAQAMATIEFSSVRGEPRGVDYASAGDLAWSTRLSAAVATTMATKPDASTVHLA